MHIFLFGSGYSAHYFIEALRKNPNANIRSVTGTVRRPEQAEVLRKNGITPVFFDAEQGLSAELRDELSQATHIVSSVAPLTGSADETDPILRLMPEGLPYYAANARFISYLSTIGVYGDYQGAWVNETSELKPLSARSAARVTAEKEWLAQVEGTDIACAILRIAGIYGPTFQGQARNALASLKQGRAHRLIKKDHVFNRIHVEDIGGALAHLALTNQGGIYNLADDEPAPAHEIITFAAELLNIAPPPAIDYETAELSPMARSFYQECKRASNAALKATGYQLRFSNYRIGLQNLLQQGEGR
ncbi:sugar nucleotide-binding protein [Pseudochrobactrum sp. sp1633]|uniref:NAD-dependent epimerase/dehydratase family protein n=1 Tax=Pseudochrobactrum sp. sp1633 TaxID=3036706 RepID=UPI0025A4F56A|nr:NAD-dependent epimerase/dehydratase family protein [Pseudochrobactrum sp. sp1633]MDM8345940.1 sugar nucleotide-binding protein [Pseudochrobactrum sp. sp1633]HWD12197.1 NAD-dependent epimerase/dehydratase family protein [Pseudochrobactrum sp.]